ncbi:MAG TPA: baseplate J/gp47 family protein [Anaerolineales bacterium]|nr:baseplate J/gp47 family protein [Anaerolineales bacterium]
MKTQILTLDVHDDYISARDKISWIQAGRILLVWPERGQVLNRRLDLTLLLRHTLLLGAQLALVTDDPQVHYHAHQLAIPVFKSLAEAQRTRWRPDRRNRSQIHRSLRAKARAIPDMEKLYADSHPEQPKWSQHPLSRSTFFLLGVLALLAIASLLFPQARVTITPRSKVQEVELKVKANPATTTVNLLGSFPVQFRTVVVEGRASLPVSGSIRLPQTYATGDILLTNLTDQSITISQGTVVRTTDEEPIRFIVVRAGQVAAGPGNSTTLPIRALLPGSSGNIAGGSLTVLEGPQGLNLVATNVFATRGGSDTTVPAPAATDRENLYATLERTLRESAEEQLLAQGANGDLVVIEGLDLFQVIEQAYDPQTDQPAEEISLLLQLEYQVPVIASADIQALATAILDANLQQGYIPVENSIEISHLTTPKIGQDRSITWDLRAERTIAAQISKSHLTSLIIGLPVKSALEKLATGLPIMDLPQISITPRWWPRLPYLPFRIQVNSMG